MVYSQDDLERMKQSLDIEDIGKDTWIFYVYKYVKDNGTKDIFVSQIEDKWLTTSVNSPEELGEHKADDKRDSYHFISERRYDLPEIKEFTDDEWDAFYNSLKKCYQMREKEGKNRRNKDITRIYTVKKGRSNSPRVIKVTSEPIK